MWKRNEEPYMQLLVKDRTFYRQLLVLALPIAAQNLVNFGVSMADTVMLGLLGEVQLSAAANANQLGFLLTLFTFGIGSGSNVMIAQFWGKGDTRSIHSVLTIMYRILLAGVLLFTTLALAFPRPVMSVFTTDEAVIAAGVEYLRIIGLSYLIAGVTSTTMIVLRAVAAVRIALVVYLSSLLTNVVFNYLLIFGNLGFPAMGVRGAAIATCIARVVEFAILTVYLIRFENRIRYRLRYFFTRRLGMLRTFLQTALPVVLNELLWSLGAVMIAVVIGRMGRQFTAANSVCTVLSQLVTIVIYGVGNASAVIIGNTVGAGKYETAKQYAKTFTVLAFILGVFSSGIVLLLKAPLLSFYNISDTAKLYADQIMTVYAVVVVLQSLAMHMLIGVLRGGGDTRFVLVADVAFLWLFSVPMGFLTGLKLGWPVWAVYAIIKSDEFFKTIAAFWRLLRGQWINDVTKNSSKKSDF